VSKERRFTGKFGQSIFKDVIFVSILFWLDEGRLLSGRGVFDVDLAKKKSVQ
jgi:hypothetical protein